MKHLRVRLFFMMVMLSLTVGAQETKSILWSFNFGYKGMNPALKEAWPIRQDVGYYSNDYGFNSSVNISSQLSYVGISPEFTLKNKKLSISPGLRFIKLSTDIVKPDYDRGGYFFLRLKSDGTVTNYTRVKAIREGINYLGVPLEIKYTPFVFPNIALYVKLSGELAYQLNSSTDIEFKMKEMEEHHDAVLRDLNLQVNPFYASVVASFGARIRLSDKFYCSMDVFLPSSYMTENNSGLVKLNSITGLQFSIDMPL